MKIHFKNFWSKKYSLVLLGLIVMAFKTGCARPKYQGAEPVPSPTPAQDGAKDGEPVKKPGADPVAECKLKLDALKLCVDLKWEKKPSSTKEEGIAILKFFEEKDSATLITPEGDPQFVLFMPSMGHGSKPTAVVKQNDKSYRVEKIFFIMEGEWEIHIKVTRGKTTSDEVVVKFSL